MMADSIEHVISYWIIFQKFHSPALGGFAVLSHWLPILFNMLIYLPLILWLWKAPYGGRKPAPASRGSAELLPMIRAAAQNRVIVSMTLLAGGASLLVGNAYQAQMPEFARDLGHGDADFTYSMLLAADAAGALLASYFNKGGYVRERSMEYRADGAPRDAHRGGGAGARGGRAGDRRAPEDDHRGGARWHADGVRRHHRRGRHLGDGPEDRHARIEDQLLRGGDRGQAARRIDRPPQGQAHACRADARHR